MALDEQSFMECPIHGVRKPTFICNHLQHGRGLGFFEHQATDRPWLREAVCRACERVANVFTRIPFVGYPIYVRYSKPLFICEGCFDTIRDRNLNKVTPNGDA